MSNYRRYSSYRQTGRSGSRWFPKVAWAVIGIVIIVLAVKAFSGHSSSKKNDDANQVTLATDSNTDVNASATTPSVDGRPLDVGDCSSPISRGSAAQPYVALTYDGGGIVGDAANTLNALKATGVPATLFVTGAWATDNADIVTAFHTAGVDVYNHSNTHPSFKGLAKASVDTELSKADQTITALTGTSTKPYFRPPFGDYDQASVTEARNQGYCMILWTVDSQDWKTGITVDEAIGNVIAGLKNGAIIVVQANSDIGKDLIGPLVSAVKAKGYTFVALKDLLKQTTAITPYTNTNVSVNSNSNANANKNSNTAKTNTNTNAAKNTNASTNTNKNTNAAVNANKNTNSNKNGNTNAAT